MRRGSDGKGNRRPVEQRGKTAWLRASPPLPRWLVAALGGLALLSIVEEFATGPYFVGFPAALSFVCLHASWPLVLRSPPLGALLCLVSSFGAVLSLDRVGLTMMSAMITIVAVTALAPVAIAVAALASFGAWALWATAHFDESAAFFWGLSLLLLISAATGSFVRLVVLNLIASRRRVRDLRAHVAQVRHDERASIARELHDIVAHELTLISLQSAANRRSEDPEHLQEVLARISDTSRSALTELRTLLNVLRGGESDGIEPDSAQPLGGLGFPEAVDRVTHQVRALGFDVDVSMERGGWEGVRVSSKEAAFRIVQEALMNVTKHGSEEACSLDICIAHDRVQLAIASGLSRQPAPSQRDSSLSSRQGLVGIRERAELLGGSVSAGPAEGRWIVRASLPI